jgi:hypothetical protein
LTKYRKILYNNSQADNSASIILHWKKLSWENHLT